MMKIHQSDLQLTIPDDADLLVVLGVSQQLADAWPAPSHAPAPAMWRGRGHRCVRHTVNWYPLPSSGAHIV